MPLTTAIYLRVSSKSQDTAGPAPGPGTLGGGPGRCRRRPGRALGRGQLHGHDDGPAGLGEVEAGIRSGAIREVVVWRLDRLGRTASGLTALFDELVRRKVNLVSLKDGLDLATPAGRLMANVLASVAAYETEVRVRAAGRRHRRGEGPGRPVRAAGGRARPGEADQGHRRAGPARAAAPAAGPGRGGDRPGDGAVAADGLWPARVGRGRGRGGGGLRPSRRPLAAVGQPLDERPQGHQEGPEDRRHHGDDQVVRPGLEPSSVSVLMGMSRAQEKTPDDARGPSHTAGALVRATIVVRGQARC